MSWSIVVAITTLLVSCSSEYRDSVSAKRVHEAFAKGQYLEEQDLKIRACKQYSSHYYLFCEEGYIYSYFLGHLKPSLKIEKELFGRYQALARNREDSGRALMATALGIALPYRLSNFTEVKRLSLSMDPLVYSYIIDGLAFSLNRKLGPQKAMAQCLQSFGEQNKKACGWGIGRSLFLYPEKKIPNILKEEAIQNGYLFASEFTAEGIRPWWIRIWQPEDSRTIAQSLKSILDFKIKKKVSASFFKECLGKMHISTCSVLQ